MYLSPSFQYFGLLLLQKNLQEYDPLVSVAESIPTRFLNYYFQARY